MRVKAYAKINLALDVLKKHPSGYHQIQTVFQQIALADILSFQKLPQSKIVITADKKSPYAQALPLGARNTVYKAIHALKKYYGKLPSGVQVHIAKNIPIAAGLGGGSADAAVTLLALNEMWELKIPQRILIKIGNEIGKDVPFFFKGGTALGTHFGEKITKLPALPKWPLLLMIPPGKISTPQAYKCLLLKLAGQQTQKTETILSLLKKSKKAYHGIPQFFHNDFEQLYTENFPRMQKLLLGHGATGVHISGSGPVIFALFQSGEKRNRAYRSLVSKYAVIKTQNVREKPAKSGRWRADKKSAKRR